MPRTGQDNLKSTDINYQFSPKFLRETLRERKNDLTSCSALLTKNYKKIARGITNGNISTADAKEFAANLPYFC